MIGELTLSEAFEVYSAYRAKIVAEDNLINHRISWMLWTEAILFGIWAAVAVPDRVIRVDSKILGASLIVISAFGIAAAMLSKQSIMAAGREIEDVKSRYKRKYDFLYNSDDAIPRLHSGKTVFEHGMNFGAVVPWIFVSLQIMAIGYALVAYIIMNPTGK